MKTSPNLRVISITGGKGGIGKTTLSINLSVSFAKIKRKVILFDADLSLANVDVLLGMTPKRTIQDVLAGHCQLDEVFLKGPHGLKIIPSTSGIQKMAELSATEARGLINAFTDVENKMDMLLIDTASGISQQVMDFTHAAQDVLLVICNDPASLVDSYAVIKILHQKYARNRFGIIVNKVKNASEGNDVFIKFNEAVAKFHPVRLDFLGSVPVDDYLTMAARERVPVVDQYPNAPSALAIQQIAENILDWQCEKVLPGGIHFLFEKLIHNYELA